MDINDLKKGLQFSNPDSSVSIRNRDSWNWGTPSVTITNIRRDKEMPEMSTVYYTDNGGGKYKTDAIGFIDSYGDFLMESKKAQKWPDDYNITLPEYAGEYPYGELLRLLSLVYNGMGDPLYAVMSRDSNENISFEELDAIKDALEEYLNGSYEPSWREDEEDLTEEEQEQNEEEWNDYYEELSVAEDWLPEIEKLIKENEDAYFERVEREIEGRKKQASQVSVTLQELEELLAHEGNEDKAPEILEEMEKAYYKNVDTALEKMNEYGDFAGVEAIRNPLAYDNYWGDTVALHTNAGDTYAATLLYDVENDEFVVTTWGDWYEQYESDFIAKEIEELLYKQLDREPTQEELNNVHEWIWEKDSDKLHLESFDENIVYEAIEALGLTEEEEES